MSVAQAARHAILLAAGKSTRMQSRRSKVLHEVGGRALLDWSLSLAQDLSCARRIVVVGTDPEVRAAAIARVGASDVVVQDPPLGTGHAALQARDALATAGGVTAVMFADTPLIPIAALQELYARVEAAGGVAVLGFEAAEPGAYGRLIEDGAGGLARIVEAKDANPAERAIRLCNSGVMAAPTALLFDLLAQVRNENAKGEYYLTDIVALARAAGHPAQIVRCAEADTLGVNSRADLAAAEAAFQAKKRAAMLAAGVTLRAPETVFFAWDTEIGADCEIEPHVVFGPGVRLAPEVRVRSFCHLEGCFVDSGAIIGPFARLRPQADIGVGAHIGNFVEVKAVRIGAGAKANHLAYLGDGEIGAGANIGAGTIFCNYDGFDKHRTDIGAGAFIGSNSALVAPVRIGAGAYVGSGSVITKDVEADALAVARGRQESRAGWASAFRARKQKKK